MMPVNTRQLFLALLREFDIDTVCDVGSMNGDDALAFRARLPGARILAFEPNPQNLAQMKQDPRLMAADIHIVGAAASNVEGRAPFFVVPAEPRERARRGMSSLHRRDPANYPTRPVLTETVRLDRVLDSVGSRLALWIDVEGHACEVLEGLRGIAHRVALLHVELESQPCIAAGQRLYPEALAELTSWNMREIAADHEHTHPQFNALFMRDDLDAPALRRVAAHLWRARLRRRILDVSWALCPACLRRLSAFRARLRRASSTQVRETARQ